MKGQYKFYHWSITMYTGLLLVILLYDVIIWRHFTLFHKSQNKIISKFIEKLMNYRIMFKDTHTILRLDYRDAYIILLCCNRN